MNKKSVSIFKEIFLSLCIVIVLLTQEITFSSLHFLKLWDFGLFLNKIMVILQWCQRLLPYAISILFILLFINRKGRVQLGALIPALIYSLCLIIANYFSCNLKSARLWEAAFNFYPFFLFIILQFSSEQCAKRFLRTATDLYIILAALCILYKLVPQLNNTMEYTAEATIFGHDNIAGFPLMMGVIYAVLDSELNGGKTRLVIYVILFYVCELIIWSASALVGAAILTLYFIPFSRQLLKKYSLFIYISLGFLLFIVLMWFLEDFTHFPPISFVIQKVLHKTLTLTDRDEIWQGILPFCTANPVFGCGLPDNASFFLSEIRNVHFHAHSAYLQTWYEGGLLSLAAILFILVSTAYTLRKKSGGIFKFALFALLIVNNSDQFSISPWYQTMLICHFALILATSPFSKFQKILLD